MAAHLLLEGTELDEAVAHDVGIGGQAAPDAVDDVAHHAVPVRLLQVGHLQAEAILASRCLAELDVLLGRARRVLPVHTYLNIVEVGLQSCLAQLVDDERAIHSTRNEYGNTALYQFIIHNS